MIIYKTTNLVNGKIYIGQSINDDDHNYIGSGTYIKKAIKKYGKDNFKKEIIERCDSKENLNNRELFWIRHYGTTNRNVGYNVATWSDGLFSIESRERQKSFLGRKHSTKTKEKIRMALTGKPKTQRHIESMRSRVYDKSFMWSDEYRSKMSIAVSGENNGMYGKRHSTDAKMKISKRLTGKTAWNKGIEKPNYFKTRLENAVRMIIDTYKLTTNDFLKAPDVFIQKAKNDGVIWKNLGISSSTIIDYGIEIK